MASYLVAGEDFFEWCHLRPHKTVLGAYSSGFFAQKEVSEVVSGAEADTAADYSSEVLSALRLVCVAQRVASQRRIEWNKI